MSTTIDHKVVEMRFDNKQFENNVATTMSSLDKLKQKLKLDGASKGLEDVDAASKKVNMSGLGTAVESVSAKFSALQVMGVTALANITNSAVNAGKRIASALTIDPIKTGLQEYETQINAVQTILANTESKGTTLDQVNGALDELNTYADKTIYNFTEMTRNIGTFTAAGVNLDTSVNAIQGIANLAAVSGSNSQQASTAMYQLSQALASGTVKLMDWNSVVNAGMGGQVFQDALKETARVHGVAIDDMIKKNGSFRETLQEGWLTADILTETLSHFTMAAEEGSAEWQKYKKSLMDSGYSEEQANAILKLSNTATDAATKVKTATQLWDTLKETAQSGWTQTWEIIIGDFEEAKSLWSGVYETLSPILEASAEARNTLLEGAMTSNWDKMITKINAAGIETTKFEEKLRETVKSHGLDVDKLIEDHGSLEEAFRSGAVSSDILKEAVASLEGGLLDLQSIERDLAKGTTGEDVKKVQQALSDLGYDLGSWGADGQFGAATEKAVKAFQEANDLKITGIVDEETIKALEETSGKVEGLSDSVGGLISDITKLGGRELLIESLKNVFDALMSVVKPIGEAFREIFPPATANQLYSIIEGIHAFTKKLILGKTASDNLKRTFKGLFAIFDIVKQAVGAVFKAISPLFGKVDDLGGGILDVTAKIGDWLVGLNETIKSSKFFEKAIDKIRGAFEKVKAFIEPVIEGFKRFGNEVTKNLTAVSTNAQERLGPLTALGKFIMGVFAGVGSLVEKVFPYVAAAAKGIGNVLSDLMGRITDSIQNANYDAFFDLANGGILATIGVFIAKFFKSGSDMLDGAGGFMENLAQIPENINNILGGVSDALGAFTDSLKADTLKKIATAIAILAASLLVLSLIPSEKLTSALTAVTALFIELMTAMDILSKMGDMKGVAKTAGAMVALSAALLILSIALKIMSTMSWSEMGVGLISMTVGLGALVGAVNLLPDKKVNSAAKAIKKLSTAIVILAIGIKIMSTMSWEEMGIGLITMVAGLGAMVGAVNLLPKDAAARAAGMIGLATAMVILGGALKIMATLSWDEVARSLAALAGSLLILAGAMALMKTAIPGALAMMIVAPALVVLAGAMLLMSGLSWDEVARGLVTLGGSLLIIAGAMALMKTAIPGALALIVVAAALAVLTPVLMALGSMSLEEIGKSLLMLAGVFVVLGVAALVLGPLVPVILGLAGSLALLGVACIAIGAGAVLLGAGLAAIATAVAASGGAITVFVASIISLIPYLIEQIGVGIIKLCEVISGSAAAICEAVAVIIVAVVDALVAAVPSLVEGVLVLLTSLLGSLIEHLPTIVAQLVVLVVKLLELLVEHVPTLMGALFALIGAVIQGLADNIGAIVQPLVNLIVSIVQGIVDIIGPIIQNVIAPLVQLLTDILSSIAVVITAVGVAINIALQGVANVFDSIFNGIATVITSVGDTIRNVLDGISETVTSIGDAIKTSLEGLADTFDSVFNGIAEVIDSVGSSIKNVLDGIAGVIDSIGEAALNAGTGFENLANGVKTITELKLGDMVASLAAVAGGVGDIAAHSDGIAKVGAGMQQVSTGASIAAAGFSAAASSIIAMSNELSSMVTKLSAVVTAFTNAGVKMRNAGVTLLGACISGMESQQKKFISLAKNIITQFANTIKVQQKVVAQTCKTMILQCATAIKSGYAQFMVAGRNLVIGFANGISANTFLAKARSKAMARAAADAAKKELDEHSPSKVGYGIGDFFGIAFVNGIADNIKNAYRTSTNLAKSAREGINNAINKIGEAINSGIDAQPTIRPVLDLSGVRSGASALSGMLNMDSSIGVRANLGAINSMMNAKVQNGTNADIVSAIDKLRKDLGNIHGDTYQVNGVTYDDGSNIAATVGALTRAIRIERRV